MKDYFVAVIMSQYLTSFRASGWKSANHFNVGKKNILGKRIDSEVFNLKFGENKTFI